MLGFWILFDWGSGFCDFVLLELDLGLLGLAFTFCLFPARIVEGGVNLVVLVAFDCFK